MDLRAFEVTAARADSPTTRPQQPSSAAGRRGTSHCWLPKSRGTKEQTLTGTEPLCWAAGAKRRSWLGPEPALQSWRLRGRSGRPSSGGRPRCVDGLFLSTLLVWRPAPSSPEDPRQRGRSALGTSPLPAQSCSEVRARAAGTPGGTPASRSGHEADAACAVRGAPRRRVQKAGLRVAGHRGLCALGCFRAAGGGWPPPDRPLLGRGPGKLGSGHSCPPVSGLCRGRHGGLRV